MTAIILEQLTRGGSPSFRFVLWADVPPGHALFYADPTRVSAWQQATQDQTDALRSGAVLESVETVSIPAQKGGPKGGIKAALEAAIEERLVAFQESITSKDDWELYGTIFDGSSWKDGGL